MILADVLNGFAFGMLIFLLAVGLALIFGVMSVLNLAHGTAYLTGAYLAYQLAGESTTTLGRFGAALATAMVAGALFGLLLAGLAGKVRDHLDQALLTLGVSLVVAQGISAVFGRDVHWVGAPVPLEGAAQVAGADYPAYRLALIGIGLGVALGLYLIIERTRLGALVRAIVADREMVAALGVDIRKALPLMLAAGSGLAAVAGVLGGPVLGAAPGLDHHVLLLALVVVVIGGMGSIRGAFAGALFVGQVEVIGRALVPGLAAFLLFGAMAMVLYVRPGGLVAA